VLVTGVTNEYDGGYGGTVIIDKLIGALFQLMEAMLLQRIKN
jgi:hypothetical protein